MGQDSSPASGQGSTLPAQSSGSSMEYYRKLEQQTGFAAEAISVMKRTVATGTTDTELAFFLMAAKQQGLDPIKKEIWCIKNHNGQLLIFASRDGRLKKAMLSPTYNGFRSAVIRANDEWAIDVPNGAVHHVITKARSERGPIIGAYYIGYLYDRKEKREMQAQVTWCQWETFNMNRGPWKTHPDEMILKCAESHGAGKQGGLSGMEVEEDFYTADGVAVPNTPEQGRTTNEDELEERALRQRIADAMKLAMDNESREKFRDEARRTGDAGGLTSAYVEDLVHRMNACSEQWVKDNAQPAQVAEAATPAQQPTTIDVVATEVTPKTDGSGEGSAQ